MIICSTISALRAQSVSGLPANALAFIAGYHSAYDGGGGFFSYNSVSAATDNGGTIVSPNTGSGRWLRVIDGDLNVLWFGAVADGTTDNAAVFQIVIDVALSAEATIYVPAGRFHIGRALQANGALRMRGDGYESVIDGTGNYYFGDTSKDLGFGFTVASQFGATVYTSTTVLYAGSQSLTLDSVTGLSVGSDVYLEVGVAASDSSQPFYRLFARITEISGTTVSLDNAIPEDVNGTAHKLWLNLVPARNISVTNLRFSNSNFAFIYIENGSIADIYFDTTNTCFSVAVCYNLAFNRIYVEVLEGLPSIGIASMYGWVLQGWGLYNVTAHDIRVRALRGVKFFSCEAESRQVFMDEIHLGLADAPGNTQQIPVFSNSGASSPRAMQVRNLYLNVLASSTRFNLADPTIFYTNVYITGNGSAGSAYAQPPDIFMPLSNVAGTLYYKNQTYFLRKQFRRVVRVVAGSGANFYDLGVTGLLTQLRMFANDLSGLSIVAHSNPSATGINILAELTVNQFSRPLLDATLIGAGNPSYFSDSIQLLTVGDGTQSTAAYLVVEGEVLISPSQAENALETLIGSAPPSANAAFFGQNYYDEANSRFYYSKSIGSGSGDWVALN